MYVHVNCVGRYAWCIYLWMYIFMSVCMQISTCVYMYVCMCVCICHGVNINTVGMSIFLLPMEFYILAGKPSLLHF